MIYNDEEQTEETSEEGTGTAFSGEEDPSGLLGLVGEITEETAQEVSLMLLTMNGGRVLNTEECEEKPDDIEFFISSGGGSVNEMFGIYDLMCLVKKRRDIATFGYGKVSSAAVLLLAAGTKGKRYIAPHTRLMLHHCSSNVSGTHPSVRTNFNELKKVEDMMVRLLADHSNLSSGEIYNIFSKNTDEYFSAEEALEMGLVDKII